MRVASIKVLLYIHVGMHFSLRESLTASNGEVRVRKTLIAKCELYHFALLQL